MKTIQCIIHKNFKSSELLKKFLGEGVKRNIILTSDSSNIRRENEITIIQNNYSENIIWDDVLKYFYEYTKTLWNSNYDYYFLKCAMEEAEHGAFESIFVGSSYSLFGIEEAYLVKNTKNLSLSSQDFYYSSKIAETVLSKNKNINCILWGCSYYGFFSDLSKTKNGSELRRITDVYYPIFNGDMHNALILPEAYERKIYSNTWDVQGIIRSFSNYIYNSLGKNYFNQERTRNSLRLYADRQNNSWQEFDKQTKERLGYQRACEHNKAITYLESYKENKLILDQFIKLCNQKGINIYFCVFPYTEEYGRYLEPRFKDIFYNTLDELEGIVHVIDFNDSDAFEEEDFNDTDHLNDKGALKASNFINIIIQQDCSGIQQ